MTDQTTIDTGASEEVETDALAPEEAARAAGWKPQDEYKGAPDKWTDAETFLAKREDHVGIMRENMKRIERELVKANKRAERADREGYQRAMTKVLAKQRAAVETGDMEAYDAAEKEREKLEAKPEAGPPEDIEERQEKFLEWRVDNDWYGDNQLLTDYADTVAGKKLKESGKPFLDDDDLADVAKRVKDRFGAKYPDAFGIVADDGKDDDDKPRRRASPVAAAPQGRARGGAKTAADLDARGRQLGEQMVRAGIFKDINEYAKDLFNG